MPLTWYLTVHMMQEERLPSDSTTSFVTSDVSDGGGSCSAGTGGSGVRTTNEGVRNLRSFAMNIELLLHAHYNHRLSFQLLMSISIWLSESVRFSKSTKPKKRKTVNDYEEHTMENGLNVWAGGGYG